MINLRNKKILLTGGSGFLGRHVVSELVNNGSDINDIRIPRSKDHDLRKKEVILKDPRRYTEQQKSQAQGRLYVE